jgi:hypothetical protein
MKTIVNGAQLIYKLARWNCHIWLPDYLSRSWRKRGVRRPGHEITDVMVLVTDHFEPARKEGELGVQRVREWCEKFAETASRHRDADGVMPQHTWFYRYDYPNQECTRILSEYVYRGFGEVEFHLHHGGDNDDSFAKKISDGVEWFNQVGAMLTAEPVPQKRFAYIAGNWALDNGRFNDAMSGCNNELSILGKAGCYADFTFPAFSVVAQPRTVNSIYYATDTPAPKSYDRGEPMRVGGEPTGDLLIFEGPMHLDFRRGEVEYASLETFTPYTRARLDYWLKAGVGVEGRPEWVFFKLHTHGMQSRDTFLGEQMERRCADLEAICAETGCRLHYVTAREAYNIAKAAEAGHHGDAGKYRDFAISRPANRLMHCSAPHLLRSYEANRIVVDVLVAADGTGLKFNDGPLKSVQGGRISSLNLRHDGASIAALRIDGEGDCSMNFTDRAQSISKQVTVRLPYATNGAPGS